MEQIQQRSPKPILWKIVLGAVVLSGVIIWIASVLNLEHVWQTLERVNYLLALASSVPVIASHWMRALRWRTMLRAVPDMPPVRLRDLFSAVMVGYTANNIIPRSGEVLRPYVLARRVGVSSALVLASVIAERMVDVLQLAVFLVLAVIFLPELTAQALPQWIVGEGLRSLAVGGLILVVAIVALGITSLGERLAVGLVRLFKPAIAERVRQIFDSFRRGLRIMRHGGDALRILVESLAIWFLYALPLWIVLLAVPMSLPPGVHWTFWDACIILLVVAIGTTIAPTPGAIGVVHALVAEATSRLYQVPLEEAFVFITIAHALNYISVMLVGGVCAAREGISLATVVRAPALSETAPTAMPGTNA
ncbi:MAG: hypothetical protein AA908_01915 [Chlorobi bacterium NICIL-2]|nr:MAG: hypothetical protein AA908_01915 [Chlorobi bacterium NICIL-2]